MYKICDKEQEPSFQGLVEFEVSPHLRWTLEEKKKSLLFYNNFGEISPNRNS